MFQIMCLGADFMHCKNALVKSVVSDFWSFLLRGEEWAEDLLKLFVRVLDCDYLITYFFFAKIFHQEYESVQGVVVLKYHLCEF